MEKPNCVSLREDRYNELIAEVRVAKEKVRGNTSNEYKLLNRYDILEVQNVEKLVQPIMLNHLNHLFSLVTE